MTGIQVQQKSEIKYLDSFQVITLVSDVHFSDFIWRLFERNSILRKSSTRKKKVQEAFPSRGGGGVHYVYGYVPPNGVVILKLLI